MTTRRRKRAKKVDWKARITIFDETAQVEIPRENEIVQKLVSLEALIHAINGTYADTGFLPPNILTYQNGSDGIFVAMYQPPQKRRLRTPHKIYDIPMPGFIFVGIGRRYDLFAVQGNEWPSAETKLFHPPTPNVYDNAGVCSGELTFPICGPDTITQAWRMAVEESVFTNHLIGNRCKSYPRNVLDLWEALTQSDAETFPDDELVFANSTLGEII